MFRNRPSEYIVEFEDPELIKAMKEKYGHDYDYLDNHWEVINQRDAGHSLDYAKGVAQGIYEMTGAYVCIRRRTNITQEFDDTGRSWWTYDGVEFVADYPDA